ncbi:hypothetical protein [uncultured Sunxiuqinia sp.]|uniref:hypothetical protein n=1 Tax=uncultured Sunxiuqinia sp. TaxID=1573825 RepID=UPI0030D7ADB2
MIRTKKKIAVSGQLEERLVFFLFILLIMGGCSSSSPSDNDILVSKDTRYLPDYDNGDTIYINVKIAIDERGWNSKTPDYFKTELTKQWQQINARFNNSDRKKLLKRTYVFQPDVNDIIVYSGCSYWGENGANEKVIKQMDTTFFKLGVIYDFFYEGAEAGEYGGGCGDDRGIGTILVINGSEDFKNKYNDHFGVYTYRAITHELGHFRGVTDLYIDVIEAANNPLSQEKFMPDHCLMNDFCYTPDEESYWSDYAVKIINKVGNQKKAGLINDLMYEDFADRMLITATKNGDPIDAQVKLYPAEYDHTKWSSVIKETPLFVYSLTNGQFQVNDLRKLFFRSDNHWDRYHVFLSEATVGNEKRYLWIADYMMHESGMDEKKTYELNFNF